MTQKITLTIKPPPGTKKLPKVPAKTLLSALTLIAASLIFGLLGYQKSDDFSFLRMGGSMACTFLSMVSSAATFQFRNDYRFKARQDAAGIHFQKRIGATFLAATTSATGAALIFNPENIKIIHISWIVLIGCVNIILSGYLILLTIIGRQSDIIFSHQGIEIHVLFRSDRVILWDDCPEPYMIYPQILALLVDDKEIYVSAAAEGIDPRIMVALINYYRTHPEHRHELTTGETITRLATGRLPIDWTITPQPQNQKNT